MFTGLVEEYGTVTAIKKGQNAQIHIQAHTVFEDAAIGDSIAINGVCLTVVQKNQQICIFDLSQETLMRTALSRLSTGSVVNLERAMALGERMGGHIVQGHVDGVGTLMSTIPSGNHYIVTVQFSRSLSPFIAEKGSIAIDGISLTIASINHTVSEQYGQFTIALISHSFTKTIMHTLNPGVIVNLEVDIIARYLHNMLINEPAIRTQKTTSSSDNELLYRL